MSPLLLYVFLTVFPLLRTGCSFLELHMYVTSALQRTAPGAVALQLALDLMHKKNNRDEVTGLRSRMNAGRPNWDKGTFTDING